MTWQMMAVQETHLKENNIEHITTDRKGLYTIPQLTISKPQ